MQKNINDQVSDRIKIFNSADLECNSAYIKVMSLSDINTIYLEGMQNPEVSKFLTSTKTEKVTLESLRLFVSENINNTSSILFGFFIDKNLCGTIRLHNTNCQIADIGIAIFDKNVWGKSWATEILKKVVLFAFENYGISHIAAGIDVNNVGSIKAFKKAGFTLVSSTPKKYNLGLAIRMEHKI